MRFDHAEYMNTDHWRQRRVGYYAVHPRRCHSCGSTDAVELHHLSYDNVYAEPDEDLMALCDGCHAFVHIIARRMPGVSLRKSTKLAIAEMKRPERVVTPSKPHGSNDPNVKLFDIVRAGQNGAPTMGRKRAREAGRRRYRLMKALGMTWGKSCG